MADVIDSTESDQSTVDIADDTAGRAAHAEHWAGWEFFLPRLPAAVRAAAGDRDAGQAP
ncbi:MAG: hypothetical protein WBH47_09505 [Streptosporangiaceae bacterium]